MFVEPPLPGQAPVTLSKVLVIMAAGSQPLATERPCPRRVEAMLSLPVKAHTDCPGLLLPGMKVGVAGHVAGRHPGGQTILEDAAGTHQPAGLAQPLACKLLGRHRLAVLGGDPAPGFNPGGILCRNSADFH